MEVLKTDSEGSVREIIKKIYNNIADSDNQSIQSYRASLADSVKEEFDRMSDESQVFMVALYQLSIEDRAILYGTKLPGYFVGLHDVRNKLAVFQALHTTE